MKIKNSNDEPTVGQELTLYLTTSTIAACKSQPVNPFTDPKMLLLLQRCRSTLATLVAGLQITHATKMTPFNDRPWKKILLLIVAGLQIIYKAKNIRGTEWKIFHVSVTVPTGLFF